MRLHPSAPTRRLASVLLACTTALAGIALTAPGASAAPRPKPAPAPAAPGDRISFVNTVDGADQVFTMNPDGSDRQQVTFQVTGTKKCDPMLNTAGTEVTYAANDGRMYVQAVGAATAEVISPPVAEGKRGGGRRPSFSADGNTIVFHFSIDAGAENAVHDLWMTDRATDGTWGPARRITQLAPGQWALHPRYSQVESSGDWLAYSFRSSPTAAYELRVAQVPRGTAAATEPGPIGHALPQAAGGLLATWSASGDKLAYVTSCAGGVAYLNVRTEGTSVVVEGEPVPVAQSSGCGLSWSRTDNNRLVYNDYSRIYVKDVTSTRKATAVGSGWMPSW